MFCLKQKTAYEMRISDWSSDVCSSDLGRMKHFQRLGFACEKRGSGTPNILNRENFLKLTFGLLLHHHGMPPSRTIEIFNVIWNELYDSLQQMLKGIAEDKPPEPMLLSIYGRDQIGRAHV